MSLEGITVEYRGQARGLQGTRRTLGLGALYFPLCPHSPAALTSSPLCPGRKQVKPRKISPGKGGSFRVRSSPPASPSKSSWSRQGWSEPRWSCVVWAPQPRHAEQCTRYLRATKSDVCSNARSSWNTVSSYLWTSERRRRVAALQVYLSALHSVARPPRPGAR